MVMRLIKSRSANTLIIRAATVRERTIFSGRQTMEKFRRNIAHVNVGFGNKLPKHLTLVLYILTAAILCLPLSAAGTAVETTASDQESIAITIYNSNIGLVKDTRNMTLPSGLFELKFMDVAKTVDVGSVHLKSLTDPGGLFVLEQNYEFDLVSQGKILDKYIGMEIQFETKDGEMVSGVLLSHALGTPDFDPYSYYQKPTGGWVIDMDGELFLGLPGTPVLPELPEGLITRPTLTWLLGNDGEDAHTVEMSYLADQLNWVANYVAIISQNDDALDLSGWVSLTNKSGATYPDATLKLVAGDIHRVPRPSPYATLGADVRSDMVADSFSYGGFAEEAFFEYHLYTLSRPTTLKDNQTKQINLMTSSDVPASKIFMFDPGQYRSSGDTIEENAKVKLQFTNSEEDGLGVPLPKGTVRVYKADASGMLQFIGEDSIKHTPKDEDLTLLMGDAFDIVCERKVMDRRKITNNIWEYDVEVEIRNHKPEKIDVTVVDHAGGDWELFKNTHEMEKKDASTLHFIVPTGADEDVMLRYTIRRNW
jgi:hypothetical protein